MSGAIFLVPDDGSGKLVRMEQSKYESEDLLQKLLADYPDLLAGEQIDPAEPRRWLFVSREIGVPDEEDGGDRWSLDHLFLDQDAIPTLVEVKRSSDTRIRREVVGQMLDYAAHAQAYWSIEKVQRRYEETCRDHNRDAAARLDAFVGDDGKVAEFWQRVGTNLKAGKIRLVFVADEIPPELRRVVEFLNVQMDPAEVLAVEIKQFTGPGARTMVPRVYGATAEAEAKKKPDGGSGQRWDEQSFFEALARIRGIPEADTARAILTWANNNGLKVWWGRGAVEGGYTLYLKDACGTHNSVKVMNTGKVEVSTIHMSGQPPFDAEPLRAEFLRRFNQIPGVSIPSDRLAGYPTFPLSALVDSAALVIFFDTLTWFTTQVKSYQPPP